MSSQERYDQLEVAVTSADSDAPAEGGPLFENVFTLFATRMEARSRDLTETDYEEFSLLLQLDYEKKVKYGKIPKADLPAVFSTHTSHGDHGGRQSAQNSSLMSPPPNSTYFGKQQLPKRQGTPAPAPAPAPAHAPSQQSPTKTNGGTKATQPLRNASGDKVNSYNVLRSLWETMSCEDKDLVYTKCLIASGVKRDGSKGSCRATINVVDGKRAQCKSQIHATNKHDGDAPKVQLTNTVSDDEKFDLWLEFQRQHGVAEPVPLPVPSVNLTTAFGFGHTAVKADDENDEHLLVDLSNVDDVVDE
jgi:hypothetical protein